MDKWEEAHEICVDYQIVIDEAYIACDQDTYEHKQLDLAGELEVALDLPLESIEAIRFSPFHFPLAFRIYGVWFDFLGQACEVQNLPSQGYLN